MHHLLDQLTCSRFDLPFDARTKIESAVPAPCALDRAHGGHRRADLLEERVTTESSAPPLLDLLGGLVPDARGGFFEA